MKIFMFFVAFIFILNILSSAFSKVVGVVRREAVIAEAQGETARSADISVKNE